MPVYGPCHGCGGSGQGVGDMACGGCGGSGQGQQMQPCPGCGGTGNQGTASYAGYQQQAPPPRMPRTLGGKLKVALIQLLPLAVLGGYVYYTSR
ncbi:hypothetical protein [Yinghuangia seranimata]|uniref:hypothetical protein n=1 Tax=Yinghuangia seranimata TaxID=408067 RepID=UPI00248CB987|nr:hypothetical protein [Yinghuangia seranimata]MDI2127698.1 hypothetical protein [Yinghuangia seranimata]